MTTTAAVLLLALGTWAMRAVGVVYGGSRFVPSGIRESLQHVAPAVLASFITVAVASVVHRDTPANATAVLGALMIAALVAGWAKRPHLAVAVTLALALAIDLI